MSFQSMQSQLRPQMRSTLSMLSHSVRCTQAQMSGLCPAPLHQNAHGTRLHRHPINSKSLTEF